MSRVDGMDSSTRVPICQVHVATFCYARPQMAMLSKDLAVMVLARYWRASGVMRIYNGQTSGNVLAVHGRCDEGEDQYRSFVSPVLFRLVAPLLQPGVVRPYLV
jgi:hypothetical protein